MSSAIGFLRVHAALSALLLLIATGSGRANAAPAATLAISQVFGGGGNSGALINQDYVEIVNPTSSAISLNGYSIQYASATGTAYQVAPLPNVTLQPGEYFLLAGATGTAGSALALTPDATLNTAAQGSPASLLNLSGTAGKLVLVSSTVALNGTTGCPTGSPVVDYVGFGPTATCFTGPAPTAILSSTLAAIRANACIAPTNNATDFNAAAPAPHNSTSPFLNCSLGASLSATGLATPAAAFAGSSTLLSVQVTPATLPTSTGIGVFTDISAIGGSTTQPFYDDGSHGDLTAGDNIFSWSATALPAGTYTFPVRVTDSQLRLATATIALTASAPPPFVTIRTIQAAKPSTYATQTVATSGIVIGVKSSGFYLEAADADTTPTTPEGILVYTGAATLPAYIAVGANVQVTGVVNTYPTTGLTPGTEIDAPQTFALISTGNTLPTPIKITAAMDSPTGGVREFSRFEGMRVAIDSVTTTSGTGASLTETTETNTSNGRFYGVVTGVPRPFREPGIAITDTLFGSVPAGVPIWDSNPELIQFDSLALGAPAIDLTSNATVTGVVGLMDFSFGTPEILIDKATRPAVSGLMSAAPVPARAATEFNVATFNMERFYNDVADADNPGSSAVTVTTAAYQRRLAKGSLAIRNVLLAPDIVGVQEIENLAVLTDLANRISTDALAAGQPDPAYLPYLFLATDGTAINTGVLVRSGRVTTVRAEQFGLATTFTNSTGAQATLNDRTPLVLHAGIKRAGGPDYPITLIVVHQRSLINVDDPTSTGATVRLKREAQAEYLATLIQGYQAAGEHVIAVGDFNTFEFSDGLVDAMGVTTGTPVPASQVVTPPKAGLVNPALTDLVTLLPPAQRQSYVETGSAQVLDHIVVTQDLLALETRLVYAHMDADYPPVYQNDATRPERVSDHDPAVAYFTVPPPPAPIVTLSAPTVGFGNQLITTASTKPITLTNTGNAVLTLTSITATGAGFSAINTCGTSLAAGSACTLTVGFVPTTTGALTGAIAIVSNAASSPSSVTLTGTGGDFSVAATTPSATVSGGSTATLLFTATGLSGYTGTVSFLCSGAITGEACAVSPPSLALTGLAQTVTVTVSTTSFYLARLNVARPTPSPTRNPSGWPGALALAVSAGVLSRRRRNTLRRAVTLCAALGVLAFAAVGCQDGFHQLSAGGTPPGQQTLTLTATANGVSRSATATLTVK